MAPEVKVVRPSTFGRPAPRRVLSEWPPDKRPESSSQWRRRTLGDGSTMLLPAPGQTTPEPQVFIGRETAIVKQHRNMCAARDYATSTEDSMIGRRRETWNADVGARALPARTAKPPPSAWWFLSPGELLGSAPNCAP